MYLIDPVNSALNSFKALNQHFESHFLNQARNRAQKLQEHQNYQGLSLTKLSTGCKTVLNQNAPNLNQTVHCITSTANQSQFCIRIEALITFLYSLCFLPDKNLKTNDTLLSPAIKHLWPITTLRANVDKNINQYSFRHHQSKTIITALLMWNRA